MSQYLAGAPSFVFFAKGEIPHRITKQGLYNNTQTDKIYAGADIARPPLRQAPGRLLQRTQEMGHSPSGWCAPNLVKDGPPAGWLRSKEAKGDQMANANLRNQHYPGLAAATIPNNSLMKKHR